MPTDLERLKTIARRNVLEYRRTHHHAALVLAIAMTRLALYLVTHKEN